ncbi:MAG: SpoIIE family protein phosphatase [bacterium]|nr:SpoIIE family protein phosphatase [bacterium]
MFTANLAATAVGAGLLFVIYEFVLRDHRTDQYVEFHIRTSNYLGVIFTLFFAIIIIYEWPIRRYLARIGSNSSIPAGLQTVVEKRLLNEPYFIIGIDMAAWITAGVTFAIFERNFGLSWQEISMNRFDALLTGLVSTTLAFFLLERVLQSYLVPYVFPKGQLYNVKGTRRINLAVRFYAVFVAISLIPMLAILVSLYRVTFSKRLPAESLEMFSSGLWTIIPIVILVGAGLVFIISLNLKKSLDAMVLVLKQVARGKLGLRVNVTSNDEIGYVGDVINDMTEGLMERDRMRQSLDLAMEVQQNLLPKGNLKIDGFDIAGKSIYCDETGGDYYDFIISDETKDRNIGVAIGDVSGHGIPAALLMATVRSSLRQRLSLPGSIDRIIEDVNRQLARDVEDSGQFMTMFFLTIDSVDQRLKWVRAGHEPGIFYDPGTDTFEELNGPGIALGVMDEWQYEMNERNGLAPGQIIVLSTDGVWEAHNPDGEIFGKERLNEIIRQHAGQKADEIIEAVVTAVNRFQDDSGAEDDITLIVIKKEVKK